MKGQAGFIGLAVGVLVAIIALILAQTMINNALDSVITNNPAGTADNHTFLVGSIARTTITFIVPLMAVGILVTVAYFGTRSG